MSDLAILDSGYLDVVAKEILRGKKYQSPILNTFFKRRVYTKNDVVAVPKEKATYDDILPIINPRAGIPTANAEWGGEEYNYYELKTFGKLDLVTPHDIEDYRKQLQNLQDVDFKAKKVEIVNQIMEETLSKVVATREYMASSAILGNVKDKDGNTLFTFDIPTANKIGDKKVSDGTDDLTVTLQEMMNLSRKASKYRGRFGFIIGENALLQILKNPDFKASQNQMASGVLDRVEGVDGWLFGRYPYIVADDWYYSNTGKKNFFNEDTILLAPTDVFAEFYGNVFTNKGAFAKIPYIDTYETQNPDGTYIRTQFKAMPIVTLPNAIVTATLS